MGAALIDDVKIQQKAKRLNPINHKYDDSIGSNDSIGTLQHSVINADDGKIAGERFITSAKDIKSKLPNCNGSNEPMIHGELQKRNV